MARRVTGSQKGSHARRDLGVAVGEAPVDRRIVEVDAEHRVPLGGGRIGLGCLELPPLDVHRHATREVTEPADVVVVKVAERHEDDVARVHADEREGVLERVPGPAQLELGRPAPPEAMVEGAIAHERAVESGVEQDESVRHLEKETGNGFAQEYTALGLGRKRH